MKEMDPFEKELEKLLRSHKEAKLDKNFRFELLKKLSQRQSEKYSNSRSNSIKFLATAAAAVIVIIGLSITLWPKSSEIQKPFEYTFENNIGYIKASKHSTVEKLSNNTFRLTSGRLDVRLITNQAKNLVKIVTDLSIIEIIDADGDTVDYTVETQNNTNNLVSVKSGFLKITNVLDLSDSVIMSGDTLVISHTNTADLIKRLDLSSKPKTEWASAIGEKINDNPKILTWQEKKLLASEMLKDKTVAEKLKSMATERITNYNELWFYIEALGSKNDFTQEYAVWLVSSAALRLSESKNNELAKSLIRKILESDQNDIFMIVFGRTGHLFTNKQALRQIVKFTRAKIDSADERIELHAVWAIWQMASNLEEKELLEPAARMALDKLNHKSTEIKNYAKLALGRMWPNINKFDEKTRLEIEKAIKQ